MSAISRSVTFLYPSCCSRWVWKWYKLLPNHHHTDVHIIASIHCCLHIQSIAEKSQERDNKSLLTDDGRKSWCGCGKPPPANISQQPYLKISLLSGVELRLPSFFISQEHKKVVCCGKIPTFLLTQRVYILIWVTITMEAIVCDVGTGQHNYKRIFNEEYIIPDSPNKNWLNTLYWPPTITLLLDTHYLVCLFFFSAIRFFASQKIYDMWWQIHLAVGIFLVYSCFNLVFYDIPVLICFNDVNPQEETIH